MKKTAFINDMAYEMKDGETILSFIRRHLGEKYIPTLCDAPNLEPFGSCRLCSVEVAKEGNGVMKTVAACHTPVAEGQRIFPDTESIQRLRRNILELVLTDHGGHVGFHSRGRPPYYVGLSVEFLDRVSGTPDPA